jgi:hypothetical protein
LACVTVMSGNSEASDTVRSAPASHCLPLSSRQVRPSSLDFDAAQVLGTVSRTTVSQMNTIVSTLLFSVGRFGFRLYRTVVR